MSGLREELEALLKARIGTKASLRDAQLDAVRALVEQKRDCLATLPTGFGKSMVYQLPAMWRAEKDTPGVTVVVAPLLSLLRDQLRGCDDLEIDAAAWCGTVDKAKMDRIDADLRIDYHDGGPGIKLLYTTPESLGSQQLKDALRVCATNGCLSSIAVDEAHCVASWGHDFRPSYLALKDFRDDVAPGVPFQALTATATPRVKDQIVESLGLKDPVFVAASLNRPNLRYEVIRRESMRHGDDVGTDAGDDVGTETGDDVGTEAVALAHLAAMAKETKERDPESVGVVYARTRHECERLAAALQDLELDCEVYHAGRDKEALKRTQGNWREGDLHCVVATVAFGMGVDKPDVRFVAHWGPPSTLEGVYQESGRAGRDSLPARCVLYCSSDELDELRKVDRGNCGAVDAYARGVGTCRRAVLLGHFGEKRSAGGCGVGEERCDVCADPEAVRRAAAAADRTADRAAERKMDDARAATEEEEDVARVGGDKEAVKRRRVEVAASAPRVPLVPTQHRRVPQGPARKPFVPPMKGTKYRLKQ